ncbi:MAG: acetyl-CoA C-acyltransferase [Oceanicaulis sp.]|jgi:acetyl-CoA C-acetyltransferase|uniref:thiolase family protein n=1 Tax=unclassified Oceanicaulis TaxID=2632123 RepID=UPI000066A18C|nr:MULTISPECIES: thiolase family protein [unclassified Oceanicaulis]EAP89841.1 acetyl-CoA acetyltransferase [Oceanicaulis sp. HTCC2633]MBC37663.1 acetyl-CoA C-acyltransferase [Oceanicaulis sp.]HCR95175.1 acetyl-CoA C-acyltransferase [Oceanicaulis sp.]|tara:strand:+ start:771 stop:1958 length:1188 start_codon:yes stop_codon:yes gene_type:complete
MSAEDPIVIVGMARTPMGGLMGELAGLSANELGAEAVKAALAEAGVAGDDVDLIYMGNVLSAGQGQAPARQAAIKGGLPKSVEATTLNKMCGSGMQAAIMGRASIASGDASVIVAGGMESMTNAPHLLPNHRTGFKYGHDVIKDHMAQDGLEDAYEGNAMGVFADMIAREHQFTREDQDAYALETLARAIRATEQGDFKREITPVTIKDRKGETVVETDELPRKARPEKIPSLKPAFGKDGTVTAANASAISDGAAALVMMRQSEAERRGLKPLAKIVATAAHAHEPAYFTTAPVPAMRKVLEKAGWTKDDVDLWEINEAFAVVPMIAMKELGLSHDVVNVNGGACALGHPIGASGARIMVTLIAALEKHGKSKGVASLCIGGGEATAVAIERLN